MSEGIDSLFREVDKSGDGKISLRELGRMFKKLDIKVTVADVKQLIYEFDVDGSRDIDLDEFRALISRVMSYDSKYSEAYTAFKQLDTDGSNTLSHEEIRRACHDLSMSDADISELIASMDADGNGIVDFDEFAKAVALKNST